MHAKWRLQVIERTAFEKIELIAIYTQLEDFLLQCCLFNVGWGVCCFSHHCSPFYLFIFLP